MTQHGAGWIIFEQSYHKGTRDLISILPPRRTSKYVADFMQQMYVDKWASIQGRLNYKKSPRADKTFVSLHPNQIHVGHDPCLVGIYAQEITLNGNSLDFVYRILVSVDDKFYPTFEERRQTLVVAA